MTRFGTVASALAIGGLIAVVPNPVTQAVASAAPRAQQDHEAHHPAGNPAPAAQVPRAGMGEMQQRMTAETAAMHSKLDALVAEMNAATGEAEVAAIAKLLTAIVEQRTTMGSGMMQMQDQMMGHVMQHMSQGMSPEMQKMMADCPMMKQMGGAR